MKVRSGLSASRRAFTLIEVLVVVAIIALLLAILLPSLKNARIQARRTMCLSNMHQLGVGVASYMADYKTKAPQWRVDPNESYTDGVALWQGGAAPGGQPTRLGMLYPRYIGKNENIFYCPDASQNALLAKDSGRSVFQQYPWSNWGRGWTYGSYEYRPRYWLNTSSTTGAYEWIGILADFRRGTPSIASDSFAGWWHAYGPYTVHTPIQGSPKMLYYNAAFVDGSGKAVKDFVRSSPTAPSGLEFKTRAGPLKQNAGATATVGGITYTIPGAEYTWLTPNGGSANQPLPPANSSGGDLTLRNNLLNGSHIDRGWTFFDSSH